MKDKKTGFQKICEYFSSCPTLMNPSEMENADLIDCIYERFSVKKLNEVEVVSIVTFYKSINKGLDFCFEDRGESDCNDLAFRLFKMLEAKYFNNTLTLNLKIFYAAVIHICFKNISENENLFLKLFRPLDSTEDESNAFCRFVVISEIELYSTCHINDVLDWHNKVINSDSHVFNYMGSENELFNILTCMWETDKSKLSDKMEKLRVFFCLDESKPNKGAYWTFRKDFN